MDPRAHGPFHAGVLLGAVAQVAVALLAGACVSPRPPAETGIQPAEASAERGTARGEIVVAGRRFPVDAPVVLWTDEPYYDASTRVGRFNHSEEAGLRYTPGRRPRGADGDRTAEPVLLDLAGLRERVDQFVLHYDVCGTSQSCFRVLHDLRGLSVHFLLDVDGTIYQTLDLSHQAWHARQANARSIGIEIAHIGAYPVGRPSPLDDWYTVDAGGTRLQLPELLGDGGIRTPDFVGRPAREGRVQGPIHGAHYEQYDFTPEQYESLVALTATLLEAFPRLRLDAPRDPDGRVSRGVMTEAEFEAFRGILGHFHLSEGKRDPGPAFDWERYLASVAERRARP